MPDPAPEAAVDVAVALVQLARETGRGAGSDQSLVRRLARGEATGPLIERAARPELLQRLADPEAAPPQEAGSAGRRLCGHYESLQAPASRRRRGAYYTPERVSRAAVDLVLPEGAGAGPIVDPACGGGAFLLSAAARAPAASLHGVDLDATAIDVARAALWLDAAPPGGDLPGVRDRLRVGDALRGRPGAFDGSRRATAFHWDEAFPEAVAEGGFAALVGNPPYGALAADHPSLQHTGGHYKGLFAGGRPNAFGLFLRRAADLVRPGGRIALVLPRSLARVASYAPLRTLLGGMGHVEHLVDVGRATSGVGYEQVIVVVRRGPASPDRDLTRTWHLPQAGGPPRPLLEAPQAEVIRELGIPLTLEREGLAMVRRLEASGPSLGDVARVFRGLPYSVNKPGFSVYPSPRSVPILRGEDAWRYQVEGHGWWQDDAASAARHGRLRARLAVPKLVLPNVVSSRIRANAAFEPRGWLAFDTVTAIVPAGPRVDPFLLLAALNSRLGTFLLRDAIFCRALLTNHMDASYLGRFPLPAPSGRGASAAREAARLARAMDGEGGPGDAQIDELIAEAYGLRAAERALLQGT